MKSFIILFLSPLLIYGQLLSVDIPNYFEDKEYTKAETELKEHLKSNPNSIEAIELLGDAYGYQEKWDDAIFAYKELIVSRPTIANYHYKYGGVLGMKALSVNKLKALTIIDDVKEAFLKAAELDENHIDTRWALVELYMQLPGIIGGSKSKSIKYANELEKLSKVDGYLAKGYIYEYDKEPELAEKYYKMAIKEGGSINCYNKLTSFYEDQNQPEKAIRNIEESQKKHQRNVMHYQIGKIAAKYNIETIKGEQCLKKYIDGYNLNDGVPIAWANYRLAQVYKHQLKKGKALFHINLAVSELPDIDVFKTEKQAILNL